MINNETLYNRVILINKKIFLDLGFNGKHLYDIYHHGKIIKIINNIKREIPNKDEYYIRLTEEFSLLIIKKFAKYIINILEIMDLIEDIPHIIRGSAGSSLVCYLTKITNIDPVKEDICLARFIHELRDSMPDIDFDFPYNLRDEIFKRINDHFPNKMARISNHLMYREKSALRKAIKEVDTDKTIKFSEIKKYNRLKIDDNLKKDIENKKKELLDTFRCFSLHCGGIIIFEDEVPEDLYLKQAKTDDSDIKQIKYNKDDTEKNGLFKIDILSNRGLAQLFDISKLDIEEYPRNDPKIFEILSKGNNIGITFAESPAMRKLFVTMKPQSLDDIAKALALVRPMAQDFKNEYLKNLVSNNNIHKYLIYDDDAITYISDLIKCPESVADTYRKAFTKNKYHNINIFKNILSDLYDNDNKMIAIDRLSSLKKYSFCKSHAYSYAKLVLALIYQKKYNPHQFWLATLNHCHSMYRRWVHFQCAKSHIELTLGKKPWYLKENKLISRHKKVDENLDKIEQYKKYGYWISKDYLIDSYVKVEFVNKNLLNIKFKGLIACGRIYNTYLSKVTFLTIGYKNDKFIELNINSICYFGGYDYIEGEGHIKSPKDKLYETSILVDNYKLYKL
jgi:DNA polymerase III alpha subunit